MSSRIRRRSALPLVLVVALALIVALVGIPSASGQEPRTITFAVPFEQGSSSVVPANGHVLDPNFPLPQRGDFYSGEAPVYASGADVGGAQIGTFYFMGAGLSEAQNFESASNHLFGAGYLELFGQGSIAMSGTLNFFGTSYLAVTGGTGTFGTVSGQCTEVAGDVDTFSCDLQ